MYLNYGDLEMPLENCSVVICLLADFQPIRAFAANAPKECLLLGCF